MSLKRNIIANYINQIYTTLVGIIFVPIYIRYMGAEAYGLVGFFSMLQAWFNLLDLGLSPTIARESARYHGGAMSALEYRRIYRALSSIFSLTSILGGSILFFLSDTIAHKWLNATTLPTKEVLLAVQIMSISIALRWLCGLYRGVISGAEKQVLLSGFTSIISSLRFIAVIFSMWKWGFTPKVFFIHQLLVALIELTGLWIISSLLLPKKSLLSKRIGWSIRPIKPLLKFSLTIAFTSSVWVLVTQTDKLALSKILPLVDYGYFTAVVLVASGIGIISGPISNAIMPHMARLQAECKNQELISVYRHATRLVALIAMPTAMILAFFSRQILWAWTGDAALVEKSATVLTLYASGYGIMAVSAFPYYLQYAKGDLKLHLIGNVLFVLFLIPSIIWSTTKYGMEGAGWTWLLANTIYFLLWTPLVHHRFAPGIHKKWITKDIAYPTLLALIGSIIISNAIKWSNNRIELTIEITLAASALLASTYFTNKKFHN